MPKDVLQLVFQLLRRVWGSKSTRISASLRSVKSSRRTEPIPQAVAPTEVGHGFHKDTNLHLSLRTGHEPRPCAPL